MSIDPLERIGAPPPLVPSVELRFRPSCPPGFAATVALRGEHDLSTSDELAAALAPIDGDLLIDLAGCEFVDSTVIGIIIMKAQALEREGHQLELFVPRSNRPIRRVMEVIGMASLVTMVEGTGEPDRSRAPA